MKSQKISAGLASLIVGGASVAALVLGAPAQADPVPTPGPNVKTITVCVTAANGAVFKHNRVIARSHEDHVYHLRSATQTGPGGCGEVAIGGTGTVLVRALHTSTHKVGAHLCKRVVYRTSWPVADAASIADGSTLNGRLKLARTVKFRCW